MTEPSVAENRSSAGLAMAGDLVNLRIVTVLGFVLCGGLAGVSVLATSLAGNPSADHLIPIIAAIYFSCSLVSLVAIYFACRVDQRKRHLALMILLFAICFRLIQLFAPPFLEIDFYRYMWDGIVVGE